MAKETMSAKENTQQADGKKKLSLEVDLTDDKNLVACRVCGHKNTKDTGICAMCSNYLFVD